VLTVLLVITALSVVAGLTFDWRHRRAVRLAETLSDAVECWLCHHRLLTPVGASAYRCDACGSVQGEGAPALRAAEKRRRLQALTLDERLAHARALLTEASLTLPALHAELGHVESVLVRETQSNDQTSDSVARFASASLRLEQLEQQLEDVTVLLESSSTVTRLEVDSSDLGITTSWAVANRALAQVQKAGKHCEVLAARLNGLAAELASRS